MCGFLLFIYVNEVNHIKFPGYACLNADCHDYHLLDRGKSVFVGCQTSMLFKEDRCCKLYIASKKCSILIFRQTCVLSKHKMSAHKGLYGLSSYYNTYDVRFRLNVKWLNTEDYRHVVSGV